MDEIQADEGNQKDDPTGKLVKESQGLVRIPVLDAQSSSQNAHRVGRNRNGNAGQNQYDSPPVGPLHEVTVEDRQREQAHQWTDAAAGFGHLQLHLGKLDDVALAQNGHTK